MSRLGAPEPDELWVAISGEIRLFRNDEAPDDLEGSLVFVQVSGLGDGALVIDPARGIEVWDFTFSMPSTGDE